MTAMFGHPSQWYDCAPSAMSIAYHWPSFVCAQSRDHGRASPASLKAAATASVPSLNDRCLRRQHCHSPKQRVPVSDVVLFGAHARYRTPSKGSWTRPAQVFCGLNQQLSTVFELAKTAITRVAQDAANGPCLVAVVDVQAIVL
jgi:hypothetical protein